MSAKTGKNSHWVKICGFTDLENAKECSAFAPDAMGFIFFEKSPRNVSVETAALIIRHLPDTIMPVGVFVDKERSQVESIVKECGLKGVQLHGSESPEDVAYFMDMGLFVIKALFAQKAPFLDQAHLYPHASAILVEYGKGVLPGGNAESWDYEISKQLKTDLPVILAGGLGPETVKDALDKACPYGVDVSSGVELSYGIKDPVKVAAFISSIRSAT